MNIPDIATNPFLTRLAERRSARRRLHVKPPHLPPTSGFTLIELLTVIVIIGILAGIMIPVTLSVRASARSAQCTSNLRQIGIATQTYLTEHKQVIYPHSNGGYIWYHYLNPYINNQKTTGRSARDYMLYCPAALSEPNIPQKTNCTGYLKNAWLGVETGGKTKLINDAYPFSRIIVFWDDTHTYQNNYSTDGGWPGNGNNADGQYVSATGSWYKLAFRHKDRCHILLLDGHVASLKPGPNRDKMAAMDYHEWLWGPFPQYADVPIPAP
ncbi:MAG: type II secretion system GspH family protein [Opitutaceae bacterium]|jgi:general secretion pathway protein G|nr:type II secretion system GspH family protein [Opitutaceae bacterium]